MHSRNVNFVLDSFSSQIRESIFTKLQQYQFICIIADKWSDTVPREHCSVSARYFMDNLEMCTQLFGFILMKNTSAEVVAETTVKALELTTQK